jgi:hypothetical protein
MAGPGPVAPRQDGSTPQPSEPAPTDADGGEPAGQPDVPADEGRREDGPGNGDDRGQGGGHGRG